jgi:hypothetical protein
MKLDAYSSLAAFLAHWRALRLAPADTLAAEELARRAAMGEIIAALRAEERAALEAMSMDAAIVETIIDGGSTSAGAARRHRERAELSLARELRARGLLAG